MKAVRLAIVCTHPIQYYAPIFQHLARSGVIVPKVFFTWSQTASGQVRDAGFGKSIEWDIPLLSGYDSEFVPNLARRPGTDRFSGLYNPALNGLIEAWGPDAILVFGWSSRSHLGALRHFKGRIPVFFRGDSTLLDRGSALRAAVRRRLLTWVYRHVDVPIAVGANNRDYYLWCGVSPERIAFAPHAIDVERFADLEGEHDARAREWRRELRISPQARVVLFAGKLIAKKDPLLLLDAFCAAAVPGHLVFAGNGALEETIKSRARGRADVHFLPFQNQSAMPALYRVGDVFALPSSGPGETWGLALNEAMASARPVIASSRAGGTRDLVHQGINGWSFPAGDLLALTAVVRNALTSESEKLRQMGRAAQRGSRYWSVATAARGIESAVLRFMGTRRVAA